jgi:hypothetical protein
VRVPSMKPALAVLTTVLLTFVACGGGDNADGPTASFVEPTATVNTPSPATPTPFATPSATPAPTATMTPTVEPEPTAIPSPPPNPTATVSARDRYAVADLAITVAHPEAATATYHILCLGDAATVEGQERLDASVACTRLSDLQVRSRLVNGAPADQICTEIYGGPDTATITGSHEGATVNTVIDRSNGCGMNDWDSLLAGILPPALGVAPPAPTTPPPSVTAMLEIVALAGPICPVETDPPSPECAPQPVDGASIVVTDSNGVEVGRGITGPDGTLTIPAPVGDLTVVPQPVPGLLGTAPPVFVTAIRGQTVGVVVDYDTGIR